MTLHKHLRIIAFIALTLLAALPAGAQTVIDLRSGHVSAKTRDDYNYKAREDWQIREDSIAYDDCVRRAFSFLSTDSLNAAQALFERALKLRPEAPGNVVVRHNIARIYMARSQWKDAAQLLTRVLEDRPTLTEARHDRASCRLMLRQPEAALIDLDLLIADDGADTHCRLLRATALAALGRSAEANADLDDVIRRDPDNAEAYLVRADIACGEGEYGVARDDYSKAITLAPDDAELYVHRAQALIALDLKTLARKDLDRAAALGIDPAILRDLYRLAQ